MKTKTSELTGAALDWAVNQIEECCDDPHAPFFSTNWAQGGPIVEREKIGVWWATHIVDDEGTEWGNYWYAEPGMTDENADKHYTCMTGPTPLIAAMRCYVASKLGDEVEVPDELTQGETK